MPTSMLPSTMVFCGNGALFGSRRVIDVGIDGDIDGGIDGIAVRHSSGRAVIFGFVFVVSIEPRLRSQAGGVRDEEAGE